MLDRAANMQFPLRVDVGLLGKFFCFKRPEEKMLSANGDVGLPLHVVLADAQNASDIVGLSLPSILRVDNSADVAQVLKTVVRRIAVDVVNFLFGPAACHVKPSHSVGQVQFPINGNFKSAFSVEMPCGLSDFSDFANQNATGEYPGAWVIVDKFSQSFCGKWSMNHFWHWQSRVKEVFNSVVASIFVLPAKVFLRESTVDVHPSKSGRRVRKVVNVNSDGSVWVFRTSNVTSKGASAPCEPSENACLWIVVKKLFESCLGKIRIASSHAVSPLKKWFGQRPGRVSSTSGLRHFSGYIPALQG